MTQDATQNFVFARGPRILFGPGSFQQLPDLLRQYGRRVLFVTGRASYRQGERWDRLLEALAARQMEAVRVEVQGEPSPQLVDEAVAHYRSGGFEVVAAIGGGGTLDAGKAIAAMLTVDGATEEYLEEIGSRAHPGTRLPLVAIPTTAGTGSEATKNAVLSRIGPQGYKRSLRHDNFVPDLALIDPELMVSCPPDLTAACGLDALTQLLEAYVSTKASPLTDALTFSGLLHFKESFPAVCGEGATNVAMRGALAYAALLSGLTLANAGLGVIHGLAGPLGGFFAIPHGVACGTLLGAATGVNIHALLHREAGDKTALAKYAMAGHLLSGREPEDIHQGCDFLIGQLNDWIDELQIPRLGAFGIEETDFEKIVAAADNKNNPVRLEQEDWRNILKLRL
ncbi:MAG: iron-containing alcohol dehydrogenase [Myxococcales bacterium]|nr:iron-containing alcohol dehydrogenase [Myxococcales bacterium]